MGQRLRAEEDGQTLAEEDGQTLLEYGLLTALIAVIAIAVLAVLGRKGRDVYITVNESMTTQMF